MTFEEALKALRNGHKVKIAGRNHYLKMIGKLYYDGNVDRPADIISAIDILRDDWVIEL